MNKVITDGLLLMPPPFSAGLANWSREDGTPGSASWAGQPNAAFVPADQDFGGCMEIQKTETVTPVRSYLQTPMQPGLYLRVRARVKAISGNLPNVRVAAWAGRGDGSPVTGLTLSGPTVTLTAYGEVVTVSAIIAPAARQGVDMVWGTEPVYGHFGLNLTGPNGGVVRIDDIEIEDVTDIFLRKMLDWVDVRDYGALGNGTTDDSAAFAAADADADGRSVLVSAGTYFLNDHVNFASHVRFEGTVVMPAQFRLACSRNFDLPTYEAAFGSEEEGFRRGLQTLFHFSDHVTFDLRGRRVTLRAPVDVAALAGIDALVQRRILANGMLEAANTADWEDETASSVATYTPSNPLRLTNVLNLATVPVGARVIGTGVGREIYVTSKDMGAGTITLSRPLWGAAGTRSYDFVRYKYMLDFSGFSGLSRFEIFNLEFNCNGRASALMLPASGKTFRLAESVVNKPKDRGITSIGNGCQGLFVDQCQFLSNEQPVPVQDRTTIAMNVNTNDAKIRDNRVVRFAHFAILGGSGNIIMGNHFFQGDDQTAGVRRAGLVFTSTNVKSLIAGNYIDNCFVEWGNEHDPEPEFSNEFSFGGLTLTGNIFTTNDVSPAFRWFVVTPYGPGHFINGLMVNDNVFRTVNAQIDQVEAVDTTHATLDFTRFRNVIIEANTFNGVTRGMQSPVMIRHDQNSAADTWVVDASQSLPFGAHARNVQSVVTEGAITTAGGVTDFAMPYVETSRGPGSNLIHLRWPQALRGRAHVTIRCDNPN